MSDDIVKRLERHAQHVNGSAHDVMQEAALAITALEARCAELEKINSAVMGDDEDKPRYTTKRLKQEIASRTAALEAELATLRTLRDRIEREPVFYARPSDLKNPKCGLLSVKTPKWTDEAHTTPLYTSPPAPVVTDEAESFRRMCRENYDAFTVMRNDINEIIGDMSSQESALLDGPEMAHECTAVVDAVSSFAAKTLRYRELLTSAYHFIKDAHEPSDDAEFALVSRLEAALASREAT